jgi:hypothetical protein
VAAQNAVQNLRDKAEAQREAATERQQAVLSRLTNKLEEARAKLDAAKTTQQAGAAKTTVLRYSTVVSTFAERPEPAVEVLSDAELGRWVLGRLLVCRVAWRLAEGQLANCEQSDNQAARLPAPRCGAAVTGWVAIAPTAAMHVALRRRRESIRAAMLHAWRGYERHAWGMDELCPVSQKGKNSFGGLGATMIDAMDTLHMMGAPGGGSW